MKIICEDTRKNRIRLEYTSNMHGYWLYFNGSLVNHIDEIDKAVNDFMTLSNKLNGEGLYFLSECDEYTGEMFDISDYNLGIYPYMDIRKRLSVGSLSIYASKLV